MFTPKVLSIPNSLLGHTVFECGAAASFPTLDTGENRFSLSTPHRKYPYVGSGVISFIHSSVFNSVPAGIGRVRLCVVYGQFNEFARKTLG